MYLRSLTVKGFKSFASATTFELEPGITCVIGPNGSGKSNVVDALAWVMGEQGAKSLRGGKMQDVIFAGTAKRAALGRAEVSLTIDNTDGALPVDYSEVTITRTMFRTGGSEYAINGSTARLLDVQELLSDSGIGREMHVIVGQNQLDSVLRATAEERRGFIEEAAGILKHRRRKEKALRKLDAMAANVARLTDLTAEVHRQLGPLGRQADVARRAQGIAAQARDAAARLLADDLTQAETSWQSSQVDEAALANQKTELTAAQASAETAIAALKDQISTAEQIANDRQATWHRSTSVLQKLHSTAELAVQRHGLLLETSDAPTGPDPDRLDAQAAEAAADEATTRALIDDLTTAADEAAAAKKTAEEAVAAEERRVAAALRAEADNREQLATLQGKHRSAEQRLAAAGEELNRVQGAAAQAATRAETAAAEFAVREADVAGAEAGELGLDAAYEEAATHCAEITGQLAAAKDTARQAASVAKEQRARLEALQLSLSRTDATETVITAAATKPHVLGVVHELITLETGFEGPISAALGELTDAIAVSGADGAVNVLNFVRDENAGGLEVLVADQGAAVPSDVVAAVPAGATAWAAAGVRGDDAVAGAVRGFLADVVVVPDLAAAQQVRASSPALTVVTAAGDVVGPMRCRGGGDQATSNLHIQAAATAAEELLTEATAEAETATFQVKRLETELQPAQQAEEAALAKLHESDAALAAVTEQLGNLAATMRTAKAEHDRLTATITELETGMAKHTAALDEAAAAVATATAQAQAAEAEPVVDQRAELADQASQARADHTEKLLAVRTAEERRVGHQSRAEGLRAAARRERAAREKAAVERAKREAAAQVAGQVAALADRAIDYTDTVQQHVATRKDQSAAVVKQLRADLSRRQQQLTEVTAQLTEVTDQVHKDEVARAQHSVRLEALHERCTEEFSLTPEELVDQFGPHLMVPIVGDGDDEPEEVPFVRAKVEKLLKRAQRDLRKLGKVNPLALEEFDALKERHAFLAEQLADLEKTKQDLLDIVAEVDARVVTVFEQAWADVSREFVDVFSRLFPGGEGKLALTDPKDMLNTGIEVFARPAGKKVKQLSLLSGGERSLTAVALLVAIFKARPSPFYVLDEVEAALDDANLGRLLGVLEELRGSSQLIVITHQKRTMEIADALYGVSMQGDGVSKVVSQRLRERTETVDVRDRTDHTRHDDQPAETGDATTDDATGVDDSTADPTDSQASEPTHISDSAQASDEPEVVTV